MNIVKATAKYEAWLAQHLRLLPSDLAFKHAQMRSAPFPFLRATYYRWAQVWAGICPEAAKAPMVLAVGDLHIENFGTWRDIEGRLDRTLRGGGLGREHRGDDRGAAGGGKAA